MPDCSRIDALVTPFVDGELPDDDQRVVSTHLTACRPCRAKVAAERAVRALIQARRAELSPGAPPSLKTRCAMLHASARSNDAAPLSPGAAASAPVSPPQPSAAVPSSPAVGSSPHRRSPLGGAASMRRARLAPFALAATLLFALGAAFLYQATRSSSRVLAAELALDHEKCFRLNRLLGTQHSAESVEAAMASGFDWDVELPDTSDRSGVTLVGSRPCLSGEGKVAHIMFRHNGEPVSLFMVPGDTRRDQIVEVFGHQCRIWSSGDRTFVLVARESPAELEQMAAVVRRTIR